MYLHGYGKGLFGQTLPLLSTLQHHHCVCVWGGRGDLTLKYIVATLSTHVLLSAFCLQMHIHYYW